MNWGCGVFAWLPGWKEGGVSGQGTLLSSVHSTERTLEHTSTQ